MRHSSGMGSGRRRTLIAAGGWLAAVVVATLIGMGGIRLIGDSLTTTPGGVLDQEDVARALAVSPSPSVSPSPVGTPAASSSPPAGQQRSFSSTGGSVIAGCRNGKPYLVTWSASPGYTITQHETESEHAEVRFEGSGGRFEIRVTCSGDTPVQQDRGGGRGR